MEYRPHERDQRGKYSKRGSRARGVLLISSDMEVLIARLVQTEKALMDTRQQVAAVPKMEALLVDTRTIGKAPTSTGEHKDWPEWSFQFTAYM